MRMIDLGSERGPLMRMHMDSTTPIASVDCGSGRQVRSSFRSLVDCLVPACCGFQSHPHSNGDKNITIPSPFTVHTASTSTVTGTFFGYRKGRVSFCLQDHTRSTSPLLLLDFAVPTSFLAREMQHGLLRIALVECRHRSSSNDKITTSTAAYKRCVSSLFEVPVWALYCNGRKVGFAIRRQVTVADLAVLRLMKSVSVGAGVLPVARNKPSEEEKDIGDHELMYLRATFKRVVGSPDSESFHMINPAGSSAQELSIFLLRS